MFCTSTTRFLSDIKGNNGLYITALCAVFDSIEYCSIDVIVSLPYCNIALLALFGLWHNVFIKMYPGLTGSFFGYSTLCIIVLSH